MSDKLLVIDKIKRLVTMEPHEDREGPLGIIDNALVMIEGDRIKWIGPARMAPLYDATAIGRIDAQGCTLVPGLIDCHTHLVHGGTRQDEFALRAMGATYQEIAARGGGIASSVATTREASLEKLVGGALKRADEALSYGVTTMEVKSGYGLDTESEIKMLQAIGELNKRHALDFIPTFLVHTMPKEFKDRRGDFIKLVVEEMIPRVTGEKLARFIDIFIEEGAFTHAEARTICEAGKRGGLTPRLHVDQFTPNDGSVLAAEVGAVSAEHLEKVTDKGIKALAEGGLIGVGLPGAAFFVDKSHYPPGRKLIDGGVEVAVATDYNPGSSPTLNLLLMATMAIVGMGLTVEEAWRAITINPAKSLKLDHEVGSLEVGKMADLLLLNCEDEKIPFYRFGGTWTETVIKSGEIAWAKN